jgi:hypothetical protein
MRLVRTGLRRGVWVAKAVLPLEFTITIAAGVIAYTGIKLVVELLTLILGVRMPGPA